MPYSCFIFFFHSTSFSHSKYQRFFSPRVNFAWRQDHTADASSRLWPARGVNLTPAVPRHSFLIRRRRLSEARPTAVTPAPVSGGCRRASRAPPPRFSRLTARTTLSQSAVGRRPESADRAVVTGRSTPPVTGQPHREEGAQLGSASRVECACAARLNVYSWVFHLFKQYTFILNTLT